MSLKPSIIQLHLSSFIMGATGTLLSILPMDPYSITGFRAAIASVVLGMIIYVGSSFSKINLKETFWICISGLLTAGHWITLILAFKMAGVAMGIVILFCHPVITSILEPIANAKRPVNKDIAFAFIPMMGIYIMMPDASIDSTSFEGALWALLAGLLWSFRVISVKKYLTHLPSTHTMCYQLIIIALVLSPYCFMGDKPESMTDLGVLLTLAIVCTAFGHTIVIKSLKALPARTVGLISCSIPVYATFYALVFLDQTPSTQTLIGASIIIASSLYETLTKLKPSE